MYETRVGQLGALADEAAMVRARATDGTLGDLPDSALHDLVRGWVAATIELDSIGTALLATWDARQVWDQHGARSGRAWLANTAELPHATARLRVAVALARRCPTIAAALAAGDIGYQQAAVIAATVTEDLAAYFEPVQDKVCDWAKGCSAQELRVVMARWRALAENLADIEPDERRHHQRHANIHETLNGMVALNALFDPDTGHIALAAIDHLAEQLRRDDQAEYDRTGDTDPTTGTSPAFPDRRRNLTQRRADALAMLIEAGAQHHHTSTTHPGGPNTRIHIFLPWQIYAAYLATRPTNGHNTNNDDHNDTCGDCDSGDGGADKGIQTLAAAWAQIAGLTTPTNIGAALFPTPTNNRNGNGNGNGMSTATGTGSRLDGPLFGLGATFERLQHPVDPTTLERLLCDCTMSRLVLDANGVPLDMGRSVRTATPAQRIALAARDGGCAFTDCGLDTHLCQAHHINEWDAHHGPTNINNLVLVCEHHHRRLHRTTPHRWTCHIDPTTNLPIFTPPHHTPPIITPTNGTSTGVSTGDPPDAPTHHHPHHRSSPHPATHHDRSPPPNPDP